MCMTFPLHYGRLGLMLKGGCQVYDLLLYKDVIKVHRNIFCVNAIVITCHHNKSLFLYLKCGILIIVNSFISQCSKFVQLVYRLTWSLLYLFYSRTVYLYIYIWCVEGALFLLWYSLYFKVSVLSLKPVFWYSYFKECTTRLSWMMVYFCVWWKLISLVIE